MRKGQDGMDAKCERGQLQCLHRFRAQYQYCGHDWQEAEGQFECGRRGPFTADGQPHADGALGGKHQRGPVGELQLRHKPIGRPRRCARQTPREHTQGGAGEDDEGEQDAGCLGHRLQYTWRCMRALDIIRLKRDGQLLTREAIDAFVTGVTDGTWPDYQVSALLMAIFLKGMTIEEATDLTQAMVNSGMALDWSELTATGGSVPVDKHSTGGVGDKTSLILAPLAAACGAIVPMMSGRGLGHTGGTLDKLAAIPGFRTDLSLSSMRKALAQTGCVLIRQTADVAPADRKMYALRDATSTVESKPLIASSILSKKITEGIGALVMDVKVGSGGFMADMADARELARWLVAIAGRSGVRTEAYLTRMDTPLGLRVGNSSEVIESIATLKGEGPEDLETLSVHLAARMLVMSGVATEDEAESRIREALTSGRGLEKFAAIITAQGGDARVIDDPSLLPMADQESWVRAPRAGFVAAIHAGMVGHAAVVLGAGRDHVDAVIDHGVGIDVLAPEGTEVREGDPILRVIYRDHQRLADALTRLKSAVTIADEAPVPVPLILETIHAQETH